uniref:Terpene synthase 20 n=1 Tax=Aquilaria sinensis TaxID=210372 RepID=A0A8E8ARH5_9ROSI|nr:terpene synthase 20 [Aquilaria sinensis]
MASCGPHISVVYGRSLIATALRSSVAKDSLTPSFSFHGNVNPRRDQRMAARRSANHQPTRWTNDYIQSMHTPYSVLGEAHMERVNELKKEVRKMLEAEEEPLNRLELIDLLERLGISYHFEDDIEKNLERIADHWSVGTDLNEDLYETSLEFRILRQHGYNVSSEKFKVGLAENVKGLLQLYEASYLAVEGENILEEARSFSRQYLQKQTEDDIYLSSLVTRALELPLHWRMPRMEARCFIDLYKKCQHPNLILVHLAQLDFNIVQAIHQQDLKHASRWWTNTGLVENLKFIRDRLMEHFLWTVGELYEPQHQYFRRIMAQLIALLTTVDDIYDSYGTLDELQPFTNVIARWDINEVDHLPHYMKQCFFELHNSVNELTAQIFRQQGVDILPFIKKAWTDLCETYLIEAKWSNGGYVPKMQEYVDNAWVSSGAPLTLSYAYVLLSNPLTKETFNSFEQYSTICRCSSLVLRFTNDLATSLAEVQRGDILKSVECYMHENGCSRDEAREHVKGLIDEAWKKMNKEILDPSTSMSNKTFQRVAMNLARVSQFMFQYGDGHSSQDLITQNRVQLLLANPVEV